MTNIYEIYYRGAKKEYLIAEIDVTEAWPDETAMLFDASYAHMLCYDFIKMIEDKRAEAHAAKYEAFLSKLDELPELPDLQGDEDSDPADYPCYILHRNGADYAFFDRIRGFQII